MSNFDDDDEEEGEEGDDDGDDDDGDCWLCSLYIASCFLMTEQRSRKEIYKKCMNSKNK
jgi:hypothetical protein